VDQRFAGRLEQRNVLSGGQILGILGMLLSSRFIPPGDEPRETNTESRDKESAGLPLHSRPKGTAHSRYCALSRP